MALMTINKYHKQTRLILIVLAFVMSMMMNAVNALETITYYHNDALGSPVAATDEAGNVKWREAYKPYGSRIRKEDNGTNDTWYTGKQEDKATGLSYFGARWYDPVIGRFTGIDPVGFKEGNIQSFNRYAYANNNPYLFVDPDGNESVRNTSGQLVNMTPVPGYSAPMRTADKAVTAIGLAMGVGEIKALLSWGAGKLAAKGAAKDIGILRDAAKGKGNFGLGTGTRSQADRLGKAWTGDGATLASDGKTLVSKDLLRQYRPPSFKGKLGKTQANFERRISGQTSKKWQSNGHLDIKK